MGSDADMEDYGFEYSDDEPEEQDVDIENQYYNSKEFLEFRLKTNVTSNLYHLSKWSMLSVEHLMSARDSFFLGSIGLLGEYCPTSRKKYTCPSEKFDYLHVEPFQEAYNPNQGYNSEEFLSVVPSQYCIKTNRNLVSTSIA